MREKDLEKKESTLPPFITVFPARKLVQGSEYPRRVWKIQSLLLCYFLSLVCFIDYPVMSNNSILIFMMCIAFFSVSYLVSSKSLNYIGDSGNLFFSSGNYSDVLSDFLYLLILITPFLYAEVILLIFKTNFSDALPFYSRVLSHLSVNDGFREIYWRILGVSNYVFSQHVVVSLMGCAFVIFSLYRNFSKINFNYYDFLSNVTVFMACLAIGLMFFEQSNKLISGERINVDDLSRNGMRFYIVTIGQLTCFLSLASVCFVLLFQSFCLSVIFLILSMRSKING